MGFHALRCDYLGGGGGDSGEGEGYVKGLLTTPSPRRALVRFEHGLPDHNANSRGFISYMLVEITLVGVRALRSDYLGGGGGGGGGDSGEPAPPPPKEAAAA